MRTMLNENLQHFRRLFYARVPVNCLNFIDIVSELRNTHLQSAFVQATFTSIVNLKYPPRVDYQRKVLKTLIDQLEANSIEVTSILYETLCTSMAASETDIYHRLFALVDDDDEPLVIAENSHQLSQGSTGLAAWQGAFSLAEFSLQHRDRFCAKNVLELGCGIGLTGLAILAACLPMSYTFTDGDAAVLDLLRQNIAINSNRFDAGRVFVERLQWSDFDPYRLPTKPDIVIGSDLCYDVAQLPSLVSVLNYFVRRKKSICYIASTIRNDETHCRFLHELDALELMVLNEWTDQSLLDKTFPYVASVQCSCIIQEIVVKK